MKKKTLLLLTYIHLTAQIFIYDNIDPKYYKIESGFTPSSTNCQKTQKTPKITFQLKNYLLSKNLNPQTTLPLITNISIILEDFNFGKPQTELIFQNSEKILDNSDGIWNMIAMFRPEELVFEIFAENAVFHLKGRGPRVVLRVFLANGDLIVFSYRFEVFFSDLKKPENYIFEPGNSLFLGCLRISYFLECGDFDEKNLVVLKSADFGEGHFMFEGRFCEVFVGDGKIAKTDVCEFEGRELRIKRVFEDGFVRELELRICKIVMPPNFFEREDNFFEFSVQSENKDVLLADKDLELKTTKPIKLKDFKVVFDKKIVNSDFELILKPEYNCVKFSVENFQIKIQLPPEYDTIVKKINIEFTNNNTSKTQNFVSITPESSIYSIQIQNQKIDPKKSFSLKITGFQIPDITGDLSLKLNFPNSEKKTASKITKTPIQILDPININFSIFPHLPENLKIRLTNSNLGILTNAEFQTNILHNNHKSDFLNIIINFKNALKITNKNFKKITNTKNLIFENFEINELENSLKINRIRLNKNDKKTYIKFDLNGLETSKIDYKQLEVKVLVMDDEGLEVFVSSFYLDLLPLFLNLENESFSIFEENQDFGKKFVFVVFLSLDRVLAFGHFLRVNFPRGFVVEGGVCSAESNLPNFDQGLKCVVGKFKDYDKSHFRQNLIFEDVLKFAVPGVFYKFEFSGYLEEYLVRNHKFIFDIIPSFENVEDFNSYQIQKKKK